MPAGAGRHVFAGDRLGLELETRGPHLVVRRVPRGYGPGPGPRVGEALVGVADRSVADLAPAGAAAALRAAVAAPARPVALHFAPPETATHRLDS